MKKKRFYLHFMALAGGLFSVSTASFAQVNLNSISVGASYWKPSLDYWNQRSLLTDYNGGQGATLGGQVMPHAALEVGLVKGLSLGARAGYWKSSAAGNLSSGGTNRSEKLTLAIVPVSLELKYSFNLARPAAKTEATDQAATPKAPIVTPYVGVGLSRYFINNTFTRTVASGSGSVNESQSGNNYGVQVFVGAERKLVKKLYLALDVRYHLGSYNQLVQTESTSTVEKVSLNGLEAGLALRLKLAE